MDSVFITTRKQRIIRELRDYILILFSFTQNSGQCLLYLQMTILYLQLVSSLFVLLSTDVVPLLPDTWNNVQRILSYISDY